MRESAQGPPGGADGALDDARRALGRATASSRSSATCAARCSGVEKEQVAELRGKVNHMFHLAAVYDMTAPPERNTAVNVGGTTHAVELARAIDAKHLHHVSSIAVAGEYHGVFTEEMFDEGQRLPSPYHRTKFESERIVREQPYVPWRTYRPAIVVGDSRTGEMDKIDGPYYFFKAIERLRHLLPEWVPLVGPDLGYTNIVPVDWVAASLEHIAHEPGLDGRAFHLVDPRPQRVDDADQPDRHDRARPALRGEHRQTPDRPAAEVAAAAGRGAAPLAPAESRSPCASSTSPRRCSPTWSWSPASAPARPPRRSPARRWNSRRRWTSTSDACGSTGSARWTATSPAGRTLKEALGGKHVMITGASSGIGRVHRAEGRRRRRGAAAGGAQRREARGGARRDRGRGRAPPTCTRPTSPRWSRSSACSSGCWPTTATSTCSSTTRAARSAARSRSATTASTTSNGRCS